MGGARRDGDSRVRPAGGARRDRRRGHEPGFDRHHESARDRRDLGARDGRPVHRAIVWQDRRTEARCRELGPRTDWISDAHRTASRSVLLGDEDRVAAARSPVAREIRGRRSRRGHDRQLAGLAAHRRRRPRDRSDERVAHDAVRHRPRWRGARSCAICSACRCRCCRRSAARAATSASRAARCSAPRRQFRESPAISRPRFRSGMLDARHRQEHVRHGRVPSAECRERSGRAAAADC